MAPQYTGRVQSAGSWVPTLGYLIANRSGRLEHKGELRYLRLIGNQIVEINMSSIDNNVLQTNEITVQLNMIEIRSSTTGVREITS